jgi:peptide/nickel transport system permease protein
VSRYLLRRLLHSIVVVLGVTLVVFALLHLSGDPARLLLPVEASAEDVAQFREVRGLNDPLPVQYVRFLANALRGDFGDSIRHHEPALQLVLSRMPATLELTFAAILFSLLIAIPVGIISALRRNSIYDSVGMTLALLGQSMPTFWLGIMLIFVVSVRLGWLPPFGRGGIDRLILPAVTLGAYAAAMTTRLLRSSLLEVLSKNYITTARAKGLRETVVVYRHALKNAAIPVVTVVGLQVASLMGGAIIVETVFAYPGMGLLAVQAINGRDYTVVQAFVVVVALLVIAINFFVDVLYTYLDPRVTLE